MIKYLRLHHNTSLHATFSRYIYAFSPPCVVCKLEQHVESINQDVEEDVFRTLMSRYLQTLNSISAENNSTIVFPVPIDIISQLVTTDSRDPDTTVTP